MITETKKNWHDKAIMFTVVHLDNVTQRVGDK